MFDAIHVATRHDLPLLDDLLRVGVQRQTQFANEDLGSFVDREGVLIAVSDGKATAALIVDIEPRPSSLPATAPDRLFVRGLVVRHGFSPSAVLCALLEPLQAAPAERPRLLIAHGGYAWYDRALRYAGFAMAERVRFLELNHVERRLQSLGRSSSLVTLRPGDFADLDALAELDAAAFPPLWHFPAVALRPLMIQGRLEIAWHEDALVGYWLMTMSGAIAHVARLAVHPQWQGRGIGRQLMLDALTVATEGNCQRVVLNTQVDNVPSQRLYHSLGFRPTGEEFVVLTRLLPAA